MNPETQRQLDEIASLYDDRSYMPDARSAMEAGQKAIVIQQYDAAIAYFLLALTSSAVKWLDYKYLHRSSRS